MTARNVIGLGFSLLGLAFGLAGELTAAVFGKLEDWCYALEDWINREA